MLPAEIQAAIKALPARIKVRVVENRMGHLHVSPSETAIQRLVALTNQRDGTCDLYIQSNDEIQAFVERYSGARFMITKDRIERGYTGYKIGNRYYAINDGAEFYMDSWEYRHMVGGQSD